MKSGVSRQAAARSFRVGSAREHTDTHALSLSLPQFLSVAAGFFAGVALFEGAAAHLLVFDVDVL